MIFNFKGLIIRFEFNHPSGNDEVFFRKENLIWNGVGINSWGSTSRRMIKSKIFWIPLAENTDDRLDGFIPDEVCKFCEKVLALKIFI